MNNKMSINTYLSMITLHANELIAPIKRYTVAEWIIQDAYICCLKETHFRTEDTHRVKVKEWEKKLHENRNKQIKCWGNNAYTKQNRLYNKGYNKKQRRTQNVKLKRHAHPYVYCSITYSNQDLDAA